MYQHMILMCSDFTDGKRIAFHQSYKQILEAIGFQQLVDEYKSKFKTVKFSFHHIQTSEESSESIAQYDKYFKGVEFYSNTTKFEDDIRKSIKITPEDVVKYMLTKGEFDKLQIQKLLFLIYSEYGKKNGKPLFDETFEVWPYGPVIRKIHNELDGYKREKVKLGDIEFEKLKLKLKLSKVENLQGILACVDSVLSQYGDKKGGELIDLTHLPGIAWYIAKKEYGMYGDIPFELVRECI